MIEGYKAEGKGGRVIFNYTGSEDTNSEHAIVADAFRTCLRQMVRDVPADKIYEVELSVLLPREADQYDPHPQRGYVAWGLKSA